jgi:dipeptidyl aminopeptidase/acylaminoacyl peptidase
LAERARKTLPAMLKLVFALALGYVGVLALLWFAQERLLFLPQPLARAAIAPPGWTIENVSFAAGDGTRLAGVLLKPPGEHPSVVMYFGGNAEEITAYAAEAAQSYGRRAVLLVNYRGYGASEGKPGEKALVADAIALYDWIVSRPDVDGSRVCAHGRSLGSGVAVQLAAARRLACIVLAAPYDSLVAVGRSHYPWVPVAAVLRHRFESIARAPALRMPALFLVGTADDIIAPVHSERLRAAWGGPTQFVRLEKRGHNDLSLDPRHDASIRAFLDEHMPEASTGRP